MLKIPSHIYKKEITKLCLPLKHIGNVTGFVSYVIFNDGHSFVLSNLDTAFLEMYWHEGLNKQDRSTDLSYFSPQKKMYLCDDTKTVGDDLKSNLESKFKQHRTFYMTRSAPECRFVFGALHGHAVEQPDRLYESIKDDFQSFCINFIDETIPLIKEHHPDYSRSFILNDKAYRHSALNMSVHQNNHLTEREAECLYWAAQGKSSEETAIIMSISRYTVEDFRKSIKRKLNCTTLVQAIYESIKHGHLGAFNRAAY